jgi:hypothetical protein
VPGFDGFGAISGADPYQQRGADQITKKREQRPGCHQNDAWPDLKRVKLAEEK